MLLMLLMLLAAPRAAAGAQCGMPGIRYFGKADHDAGTQNWAITQGDNQMMYFANNSGLLEFDGEGWRVYNDSIPWAFRSVLRARGRIYVGTFGRIGYYAKSPVTRRLAWHPISLPDSVADFGDFWGIVEHGGRIVFQSQSGLLLTDGDSVRRVVPADSHFLSAFSADGRLYVCDENRGLLSLDADSAARPVDPQCSLGGIFVTAMMPLPDGRTVVCTRQDGLFVLAGGRISRWDCDAGRRAMADNIFCATLLHDGRMALGTIQGGIVVADADGRIVSIIDKRRGLANNTVLSLYEDRTGNLWAGLDNGIACLAINSEMSYLQEAYDIGTGYCMITYGRHHYFGTNQGLFAIDTARFADPAMHREHFVRVPGTGGQVWSLSVVAGQLLCGHDMGAFVVRSPTSAERITPPALRGVWNFNVVNDSTLLCGTYYGITRFGIDRSGHISWQADVRRFSKSGQRMQPARDGSFWLTHGHHEVLRVWLDSGCTEAVRIRSYDDFARQAGSVTVCRAHDDVVFCSQKGVFKFDYATDTFVPYTLSDFGGVVPKLIQTDDRGNIWFFGAHEMGLLRKCTDGYETVVSPFVPLRGRLLTGYESVFSPDADNTFIGIENGFAHYTHRPATAATGPVMVHIRNSAAIADSLRYDVDPLDSIPLRLEYPYVNNSLIINFAATLFGAGRVQYSTRVDGIDHDWTPWGTRTTRELTMLREGDYTFHVKALAPDGLETDEVSFGFKIEPPFARSLTMKILISVLAVCCGVGLWWYSNQRVRMQLLREEERQRLIFERESEALLSKALQQEAELVRIKNEQLESESIRKEKELANRTLSIIKVNELMQDVKAMLAKAAGASQVDAMKHGIRKVIGKIDFDCAQSQEWQLFDTHFENVHREFFERLRSRFPSLTQREMKLAAYIRMGLSSKEIAALTNITYHAVENNRSALRGKLGIGKANLKEFIQSV